MNIFEKTQILPITSTLFRTSKMKSSNDYSWASKDSHKRLKNQLVKFLSPVPGCGGDLWIVQYLDGKFKGQTSCFNASELSSVRITSKIKNITVKSISYEIIRKNNRYEIKKFQQTEQILNFKSSKIESIMKKVSKLDQFNSKMYVILDSDGLTQKELIQINSVLNQKYHKDFNMVHGMKIY